MIQFMMMMGEFFIKHGDLINALFEAIEGGATKEELLKAIRASMVAASDAEMARELK